MRMRPILELILAGLQETLIKYFKVKLVSIPTSAEFVGISLSLDLPSNRNEFMKNKPLKMTFQLARSLGMKRTFNEMFNISNNRNDPSVV